LFPHANFAAQLVHGSSGGVIEGMLFRCGHEDFVIVKENPTMGLRLIVIALIALIGLAQSQDGDSSFRPAFEVISIKPDDGKLPPRITRLPGGGLSGHGITAKFLIGRSYDAKDFQIIGGSSWIGREIFAIEAKPGENRKNPILNLYLNQRQKDDEEFKLRIQSLLADRFLLRIHRETREETVYSLVVAKNGPKFKESGFDAGDAEKGRFPGLVMRPNELLGTSASLDVFAAEVSRRLGHNVIDRTGLNREYDFDLRWAPDTPDGDSVPDGPSIFTALQEQLGLKLESGKAPVDAIVIDNIEKPTEN
jgi:bla regulator protein BlaR1